jgi:hypothetical protein
MLQCLEVTDFPSASVRVQVHICVRPLDNPAQESKKFGCLGHLGIKNNIKFKLPTIVYCSASSKYLFLVAPFMAETLIPVAYKS